MDAIKSLEEEDLKNEKLIGKINEVLNQKLGVDKETFEGLMVEYANNEKIYEDIFKAVEDELINKWQIKI